MTELINEYGVVDPQSELARQINSGLAEFMDELKVKLDEVPLRDIRAIQSYLMDSLGCEIAEYVLRRQMETRKAHREARRAALIAHNRRLDVRFLRWVREQLK